jgi:hypothetical protein
MNVTGVEAQWRVGAPEDAVDAVGRLAAQGAVADVTFDGAHRAFAVAAGVRQDRGLAVLVLDPLAGAGAVPGLAAATGGG